MHDFKLFENHRFYFGLINYRAFPVVHRLVNCLNENGRYLRFFFLELFIDKK